MVSYFLSTANQTNQRSTLQNRVPISVNIFLKPKNSFFYEIEAAATTTENKKMEEEEELVPPEDFIFDENAQRK
jgi:hypothetical protein